jgi:hypothetical protein
MMLPELFLRVRVLGVFTSPGTHPGNERVVTTFPWIETCGAGRNMKKLPGNMVRK